METAADGSRLWIRISGAATLKLATAISDCLADFSDQDIGEVWIELSGCERLDSTFAGTLVGLAQKHRQENGPAVHVNNPSAACLRSLRQMHLEEILCVDCCPVPASADWKPYQPTGPSRDRLAKTVILAHEDLASAHPENKEFGRLAEGFKRGGGRPQD